MRKGFMGKGKLCRTRVLVTELLMILQCITVTDLFIIVLIMWIKNIRNIFKHKVVKTFLCVIFRAFSFIIAIIFQHMHNFSPGDAHSSTRTTRNRAKFDKSKHDPQTIHNTVLQI
jgi:hypothetical protein